MLSLSKDILAKVVSYWGPQEILDSRLIAKGFYHKEFFETLFKQLRLSHRAPWVSPRNEIRLFCRIKIQSELFARVAQLVGPTNFHFYPTIEIKDSPHLCYEIAPEDVTHPIMKGKDALNQLFITLRYKDNAAPELKNFMVFFLCENKKKKVCNDVHVSRGGSSQHKTHIIHHRQIGYMRRLIQGRPCGHLRADGKEIKPRQLPDGRSVVYLY